MNICSVGNLQYHTLVANSSHCKYRIQRARGFLKIHAGDTMSDSRLGVVIIITKWQNSSQISESWKEYKTGQKIKISNSIMGNWIDYLFFSFYPIHIDKVSHFYFMKKLNQIDTGKPEWMLQVSFNRNFTYFLLKCADSFSGCTLSHHSSLFTFL